MAHALKLIPHHITTVCIFDNAQVLRERNQYSIFQRGQFSTNY